MTQYLDVKIWQALKARFDIMPTPFTVAYTGETFDPPASGGVLQPYFLVEDFRMPNDPRFLNGPAENRGILNVSVMLPVHMTHANGLALLGQVANWFPSGLRLTGDGVRVDIVKPPQYINNAYRDGAYNRYPCVIYWRCSA